MFGQFRGLLYHVMAFIEQQTRLRILCCRAVYLCAALAVRNQHIQGKPRKQGAFAVLTPHKEKCFPVTAQPRGGGNKAEQGLQKGFLKQFQPHRLSRPFSLAVAAETLYKGNGAVCFCFIKDILPRCPGFLCKTGIYRFYPSASGDFAPLQQVIVLGNIVHADCPAAKFSKASVSGASPSISATIFRKAFCVAR